MKLSFNSIVIMLSTVLSFSKKNNSQVLLHIRGLLRLFKVQIAVQWMTERIIKKKRKWSKCQQQSSCSQPPTTAAAVELLGWSLLKLLASEWTLHGVLWFTFFKVTWPLKPDPLGQSRAFGGNNEIWVEVYQNLIKKEDSQKDHSLSTTGNLSAPNVPPTLSFYNSPESFSHLPHSSAQPGRAPQTHPVAHLRQEYTWELSSQQFWKIHISPCLPCPWTDRTNILLGQFLHRLLPSYGCVVTLWNSRSLCMKKLRLQQITS